MIKPISKITKISNKVDNLIKEIKKIKIKDETSMWHLKEAASKLESSTKYLYYASIK